MAPVVAFAQNLSSGRKKITAADVRINKILQYLHLGMYYLVIFGTCNHKTSLYLRYFKALQENFYTDFSYYVGILQLKDIKVNP